MQKKILLILLLIGFCQFSFFNSANAFGLPFKRKPKIGTPESQALYKKNVLKNEAIERYERSLLPESGYMTVEEYENLSKYVSNSEKDVPEYKLPKDIKMKYVPQPIYKLARYNDPPGSPELHIGRNLFYNRQLVCPGITSPNKDILVYPTLYYYVVNQCTACDLFVVPLDKTLPDISRIQRANIVKRIPQPILSTDKSVSEKYIFRTLTPIDFSVDGSKLAVKEKTGSVNDGIWQTNLIVYDFNTKKTKKLTEIRDAIEFYWLKNQNLVLDEKRWDIYPLGFDAQDQNRLVVSAVAYTGNKPVFLGNWSIDCNGERSLLISLLDSKANISMNGFKIVKEGLVNPEKVFSDEKLQNKFAKQKRKEVKKANKTELKNKKKALKKEIKEINKKYADYIKSKENINSPTSQE